VPRTKLRTPALRAEVLRAALTVLADDGVSGLTARRVAQVAETSVPAVYELFGDKAGLVREVFFEGFRRLGARFSALAPTDDPGDDLRATIAEFRAFARDDPVLAVVMFSRPFADFDPGPAEIEAGSSVREHVVGLVRRAVTGGAVDADPTDVAHGLLALAQGLTMQESAGWLGRSATSVDRRWDGAVDTYLRGLGSI
jgi:AcrR family transcriptional regulator